MKNYYMGFDMGTESLGWAATDCDYNVLKNHGKALWGVHLYDEALPAVDRRTHRADRRRLQRRHQRMMLLRELFSEEICKVDANFFQRLDDSKFYQEDKMVDQKNTLFCDKNYTDKDYHNEYPTIYHLRSQLIHNEQKYDIRLVYLAIANIIKHRGHFLFDGLSAEESREFEPVFQDLISTLEDYEIDFACDDTTKMQEVLQDKSLNVTNKNKILMQITNATTKQQKDICKLLAGGTVTFATLFDDETLKDAQEKNVTFKSGYEDKQSAYESVLDEKMYVLEKLKALYDWAVLSQVLDGEKYLSDAKINQYEKHSKDLELLKALFKKYSSDNYKKFFDTPQKKEPNYASYVSNLSKNSEAGTCSQEDMCKYAVKLLGAIEPENNDEIYILDQLQLGTALPKQVTKDNSVIPNQIHRIELQQILNNAAKYYSFLNEVKDGKTVFEKIQMLLTFRIPYYVGPLNSNNSKNAWIVRKDTGKIYPWNFNEKVNKEESAKLFIERMTNYCSYLVGEKVLAKESLLYSKFAIYNQLNNIKIDDVKLPSEIKNKFFEDNYLNVKKSQKVTSKKLVKYLCIIGYLQKENDNIVTGIDNEIVGTMKSYVNFQNIIGSLTGKEDMVEDIINHITVLGDSKKLLKDYITNKYSNQLTEDEINKISNLKYTGWGRLSTKFLTGIDGVNKQTGEVTNIITAMENTDCNLMQLLSDNFSFKEEIDNYNKSLNDISGNYARKLVDDSYVSPSVKRAIWRTLTVAKEIVKIKGYDPEKIFMEMPRGPQESKRTVSRKQQLLAIYKNLKKEYPSMYSMLEKTDENSLRSKKLYHYFLQFGKCAYSGRPIDIDSLQTGYDIEHIYPRSKTKDDSLDNLVLVEGVLNKNKSDQFPLPSSYKTPQTLALWTAMLKAGTMSKEKHYRLTRTTPLTADELAGFINRQIVETGQSTKATANILKQVYPNSEVVYVKAGNVTKFRQDYGFIKSRSVNDYHHAKDAYLNIVVGNVYNTKFTKSPANFIKAHGTYSLNKMFEKNVSRGNTVAWVADDNKSIKTVSKYMDKNNILYTRYAFEQKGGMFDQMPMKAGKGQMPLKSSDNRLLDISKYGGYNKISGAYFALVKHTLKGKTVKTIEYVPVYSAKEIEKDSSVLQQYFDSRLTNPTILIKKIKMNTLFDVDGFKMHITGRSDSKTSHQIIFKNAIQLVMSNKQYQYFKKIDNYIERNLKLKGKQPITPWQELSKEENLEIYDLFTDKLTNTIYNKKLSAQVKTFVNGRDLFINLDIEDQCILLSEAVKLFECNSLMADLTLVNGAGKCGSIKTSNDVSKFNNISIIYQSATGCYETKVDLASL